MHYTNIVHSLRKQANSLRAQLEDPKGNFDKSRNVDPQDIDKWQYYLAVTSLACEADQTYLAIAQQLLGETETISGGTWGLTKSHLLYAALKLDELYQTYDQLVQLETQPGAYETKTELLSKISEQVTRIGKTDSTTISTILRQEKRQQETKTKEISSRHTTPSPQSNVPQQVHNIPVGLETNVSQINHPKEEQNTDAKPDLSDRTAHDETTTLEINDGENTIKQRTRIDEPGHHASAYSTEPSQQSNVPQQVHNTSVGLETKLSLINHPKEEQNNDAKPDLSAKTTAHDETTALEINDGKDTIKQRTRIDEPGYHASGYTTDEEPQEEPEEDLTETIDLTKLRVDNELQKTHIIQTEPCETESDKYYDLAELRDKALAKIKQTRPQIKTINHDEQFCMPIEEKRRRSVAEKITRLEPIRKGQTKGEQVDLDYLRAFEELKHCTQRHKAESPVKERLQELLVHIEGLKNSSRENINDLITALRATSKLINSDHNNDVYTYQKLADTMRSKHSFSMKMLGVIMFSLVIAVAAATGLALVPFDLGTTAVAVGTVIAGLTFFAGTHESKLCQAMKIVLKAEKEEEATDLVAQPNHPSMAVP